MNYHKLIYIYIVLPVDIFILFKEQLLGLDI